MEIIFGIIVVIVLLVVIGKIIGAPEPSSMSEAAILVRLQTENAWMTKYSNLPYSSQQSASIKRMYEEKTAYIKNLKTELIKRQIVSNLKISEKELMPIFERLADLMKEGRSENDALLMALREWHEKNK